MRARNCRHVLALGMFAIGGGSSGSSPRRVASFAPLHVHRRPTIQHADTQRSAIIPTARHALPFLPSADQLPFVSQLPALTGRFDAAFFLQLTGAAVVGYGVDPVVERLFNMTHRQWQALDDVEFDNTLAYGAANSIATAAKVFGAAILADALIDFTPGLYWPSQVNLRETAPSIAITIWAAMTLSTVKRIVFQQAVAGNQLGRVALYDKLLDFVLGTVTAAVLLDELQVDIGMGFQSLFAAGGVGALAFSLASKSLAEQIVGGFVIRAWDAFDEGDCVMLGDGTEGTVGKIGLVESEIIGYDNIPIRIPNSELCSQRVSNFSRIYQSRVVQNLRFKYTDLNKVPQVLGDILTEIKASCPDAITDGSKTFSAVLTGYEPDHIQTKVSCHFNVPPGSAAYGHNREELLLAIARALSKNEVEFALPSISYQAASSSTTPLPHVVQQEINGNK